MFQAPRGTADILPDEQAYWRCVEEKAINLCQLRSYQRIDTPVFEDTRLFQRGVGEGTDIVEKEMYTFEDRGGSHLTLRPEGTAPICRAYLEHGWRNLPQPVKLFYFAPIFRYERPQAGRYRQHQQFGFEALGEADPALDAEVIDMAWQLFAALGLSGLSLKLNSIGCLECRPKYLERLKEHYAGKGNVICRDCKVRLAKNPLRLLDCKEPSCQPIADAAPKSSEYLCPECHEHYERLRSYLRLLEVPFEENHRLVRGLDYYTRTVFEVQPEAGGAQSTLGGGGRYDGLIEQLGGPPTPGVGFATGMERIVLNMKKQGIVVPPLPKPEVFVAHVGELAKGVSFRIVAELRRSGIAAIGALGNKSLKAQLRQANALCVAYALILGEEEIRTDTVLLRYMAEGNQVRILQGDAVRVFAKTELERAAADEAAAME